MEQKQFTEEEFKKFIDKLISYKDVKKAFDEFAANRKIFNEFREMSHSNKRLEEIFSKMTNEFVDAYPEIMENPEKYSTNKIKLEKIKKLKKEIKNIQGDINTYNIIKDSPNSNTKIKEITETIKELTKKYHERRIELLKWTIDETQIRENHFKDYDSFINS